MGSFAGRLPPPAYLPVPNLWNDSCKTGGMRALLATLLVAHGLLHLIGVAKAFGVAALPQLTEAISPTRGAVWLASTLFFLGAAVALYAAPRWWWAVAGLALATSTAAIASAWTDAWAGAAVNVLILVAALVSAAVGGPWSLRAEYDRDVQRALAHAQPPVLVTESDLEPLPPLVRRYLRTVGVVGQPHVRNMRVRMRGRIRNGPEGRWMALRAEQHNVFGEPTRLFYMTATMMGVPVDGYHRFVDRAASMRIRAAGLVSIADASGNEMTRAETVTIFNDMCLMAPATLLDPSIRWETRDAHTVQAAFTHASETIRAELVFDDAGALVDFRSDDRRRVAADGRSMHQARWSTPVESYRPFGPVRLMGRGRALWHEPTGDYAYIELELEDVQYNVR